MSERRTDPTDLWRNATDAVASGVRKTLDYQRSAADDYQRWFADQSQSDTPVSAPKGWTEFRSGLTDYGSTVIDLTANYYRDLADATTRFVEQAYPRFVEGSRATTDYGPQGRTPQRATISLRGTSGESVEARFSIENSDDQSAEVIIETGTCRGPDGEGFSAAISLSNDALVIAPHSSYTIVATVDLTPALFTPGGRYRLPISVHGPNPTIIELEILVDPASDADDGSNGASDGDNNYAVRCPSCRRTFERTTSSLVLRPHNDEAGNPCPERRGKRAR